MHSCALENILYIYSIHVHLYTSVADVSQAGLQNECFI